MSYVLHAGKMVRLKRVKFTKGEGCVQPACPLPLQREWVPPMRPRDHRSETNHVTGKPRIIPPPPTYPSSPSHFYLICLFPSIGRRIRRSPELYWKLCVPANVDHTNYSGTIIHYIHLLEFDVTLSAPSPPRSSKPTSTFVTLHIIFNKNYKNKLKFPLDCDSPAQTMQTNVCRDYFYFKAYYIYKDRYF